jgi:hypothetical protein|uniref:Uncharacterized protein n=1 Tax=Eutreptiella gymnastica TaxID=73025 RepID=A0A7S4LAK3_9EUGL
MYWYGLGDGSPQLMVVLTLRIITCLTQGTWSCILHPHTHTHKYTDTYTHPVHHFDVVLQTFETVARKGEPVKSAKTSRRTKESKGWQGVFWVVVWWAGWEADVGQRQ